MRGIEIYAGRAYPKLMSFSGWLRGTIIVLFVATVACGEEDGNAGDDCVPACSVGESCVNGACVADMGDAGARDGGPAVTVVGLTVTPTAARVLSEDGARPTVAFSFVAQMSDGTTMPATLDSAEVDPVLLGTYTATAGVFTASGRVGGDGQLIGRLGGFQAVASINVMLRQSIFESGTSTETVELFEQPGVDDPTRNADVVYPLDGAVMPQNVAPANVQWMRSATGDAFRITLRKPNAEVLTYYQQDADPSFSRSWIVDLDAWRRIAQTEPSEPAVLTVDRYEAASQQVVVGRPIQMRFPPAALLGSVYYWDIARGRIVRIPDGTTTPEEFMPNPRLNCVGCHSVSPNGRYMAGRLGPGENQGGVYDLTRDLTGNPPPGEYTETSTVTWWFSSWNPAGDRLVVSYREQAADRALRLLDPFLGRYITSADATLPSGAVTHPDWAPDGASIAYIGDANNWGGQNTTGNIYILEVTGRDTFGASAQIVDGTAVPGTPAGNAANYPSFSPDSQKIAFAHGTSSRSENGQSALYLVNPDGTGLVRLDNACGGADTSDNFQPRFSPFEEGGYYWMSFLSRRDYGNELVGTRGRRLQQVWVSAIRVGASSTDDPSAVPYWLPGQRTTSRNISAYWAARACRDLGEACGVDAECCSGACSDDGMCEDIAECREVGQSCTDSSQCCNGVLCIDDACGGGL